MMMKKATAILSVALCGCLLSGCSNFTTSASSSTAPPTSPSAPTPPADANACDGASNFPASSSPISDNPAGAVADSSSESVPDEEGDSSLAEGLIKYDSIYDIPFADLEYETDRNCLSLNGEPWVAAPGPSKLGDLCFSDGKILIIQDFYGDPPNFVWFTASFDPDVEAPYLPEETENKLFTHAEGYTLYTDDGYEYTVSPCDPE